MILMRFVRITMKISIVLAYAISGKKMTKDNTNIIIGFFYFGAFIGGIVLLIIGLNQKPELLICRDFVVAEVGACNEYGTCRVQHESGAYSHASYPIRGMRFKDCKEIFEEHWTYKYKNIGYKLERRLSE